MTMLSPRTSFVINASMKPPAKKLKNWNIKLKRRKLKMYENKDRKCECYLCELNTTCPYVDKYQRLGREHKGALALCKKLEENQRERSEINGL